MVVETCTQLVCDRRANKIMAYCNDNEMIEWYHDYQKRKAQKAKIKDELMPIACPPSRWWDWCVPEDEKRETEKIFLTT